MKTIFFNLIFTFGFIAMANEVAHSQDQVSFSNIDRYKVANMELALLASEENRVVLMGDSITEGWNWTSPDFLKETGYINRGIGGQTTPQMLVRFRVDVIDLQPRIVVILAGTNDLAGNTGYASIASILGNIKSMAEIASHNGIEVILASVLPAIDYPWKPGLEPAPKIIELNEKLKIYAQKNNFIYLDYYSALVDGEGGLKVPDYTSANDLVHPNKSGYTVMEALLRDSVQGVLRK